jgi:Na+/phosphate symporter
MKETETQDYKMEIHSVSETIVESLSHLFNAFIYNKTDLIDEVFSIIDRTKENSRRLTEVLLNASPTDETARIFSTIPSHLERMAGNLEQIARLIRIKINDNLLFSDRAVEELSFLFNRTKEVLQTVSELILARNVYLANYIKESGREIENSANRYATLHEERLIEGLCLPKSSGIYITVLDSLKRIAWNAREIAEKIT